MVPGPPSLRQSLKSCRQSAPVSSDELEGRNGGSGLAERTLCSVERYVGRTLLFVIFSNSLASDRVRSSVSLYQVCPVLTNFVTDLHLYN